jgi:predicted 2-oxoglutarate/Fe(II)-dependent dioxygenase YbiX
MGIRRAWYVLDPRLRIIAVFPFDAAGAQAMLRLIAALPAAAEARRDAQVPVLMLPGVFEPEFCTRLIGVFDAHGGKASGVFTETSAGEGAAVTDGLVKRRRDLKLTEPALVAQVQTRIFRRVVPEIRHAFQFHATRLERLILACYHARDGGHFAPHRDNTVAATAHRRFAVSINLNDDFDGGGVSFPEYSPRAFKPAAGGALVFSCSLMHAVSPMLRGRRMACLPFVYDEAAAAGRRQTSP